MEKSFVRKPIGNFFIKKELQTRLIVKIVLTVLVTTVLCLLSILFVFYMRYKTILLYQMDIEGNLSKEHIVDVLLPSLIVSALVNILVGVFVGLYASRKYAVPIYKLEQWAMLLRNGHLNAKLVFREKEEMKELSDHCNSLGSGLRTKFVEIVRQVNQYKEDHGENESITKIEQVISDLELQTGLIDVTTGFYDMDGEDKKEDAGPSEQAPKS